MNVIDFQSRKAEIRLAEFAKLKPLVHADVSDLAEKMYNLHGQQVPEGREFSRHHDEMSKYCWNIAAMVYMQDVLTH